MPDIRFDKGRPLRPLEQLMGVFPSASAKFLPPAWARMMTDENSALAEFYPRSSRRT